MPILALTRDGYKWPQVLIQVQLIHSLPFVTTMKKKTTYATRYLTRAALRASLVISRRVGRGEARQRQGHLNLVEL